MIKLRERKYRFWDIEKKQMRYPRDGRYPDLLINPEGQIYRSDCVVWDDLQPTEDFILMNWLGITDKNGKDIYELDFVKFYGKFYGKKEDRILLVEYAPRCAAFLFSDNPKDKMGWGLTFPDKNKYYEENKAPFLKIVGNYFEDPELLTQEGNSNG